MQDKKDEDHHKGRKIETENDKMAKSVKRRDAEEG